jgi:hypothetical protein
LYLETDKTSKGTGLQQDRQPSDKLVAYQYGERQRASQKGTESDGGYGGMEFLAPIFVGWFSVSSALRLFGRAFL